MADDASLAAAFTVLDWVGVALAAVTGAALCAFPFAIGRPLAELYAELGMTTLPLHAALATSTALPLTAGVAALALTSVGLAPRLPLRTRRACAAGGFALAIVVLVACTVAAYGPIFGRADAVRVEPW
ncbi:MAG: hypothetical protein HY908_29755 [Myxococcales bacterium]|nr:hypothetical protein [Myxococcales bacterium]